ncbi:PCYCGC domain-containing protein [Fictibacillus nanhaiensis]|uniref:PCYCGC domain-containing protein n=1 Tax=Fictibacillus nanhaiensis TaxID=742169 RepID=UPI001C976702|nr:PCYCGC domain-containing protein [Fictibacillus nanhaiensis]MBY6037970.1 PCYCGC domain-containing protein [Fictibacillus nanhaiensis]
MKRRQLVVTMTLAAGFLIAGCGNEKKEVQNDHHEHEKQHNESDSAVHQNHLPNGDIQELTASIDTMPRFLKDHSKEIGAIYAAAPQFKEVLESMPCYCGCGESAGHRNNYDCFVAENKEDGEIVWDDHGTKCGTCLEIAAVSMKEAAAGKSTLEIRKMIDEKYKEGYAKPTPTPMPAS